MHNTNRDPPGNTMSSTSPLLQVSSFVFDPPQLEKYPSSRQSEPYHDPSGLKMTAKRYTLGYSADNTAGFTLLFAHCIGSHKEQWEPTIERMFHTQNSKSSYYQIREAWAFDWQNHGDAARLNEQALKNQPEGVSVYEWAEAIVAFVRSPRMAGHRIIPVGHSAGAGAMMLTTKPFPVSGLPYTSIVLVEATMITQEIFEAHFDDRIKSMEVTVAATESRRDAWANREEAYTWLSRRFPFRTWDPRVDHGLYQKSPSSDEVALKCDRKQEAVSYPDVDGHFEATLELARVCHALPVHIIWGGNTDLFPDYFQDCLSDATQGRVAASVLKVHGGGHLIVQEKPDQLALKICEALDTIHPHLTTRSRL
ncbi:hypothetical protein D9757_010026 [Collybiopsis confluens]|uniref:AB hydrolase-1 domain-containing protein n=1 Tax=Collybiopsis confluens TaxID=2823264 RepID=A0A8H5GQK7_9AGAR|nr:hypothetical protein D9757_010026 [Collybiopsis confluens]